MNLLIRADASVAIGTGHVMRCLALAQAWQDAGGKATFAMTESTPAIKGRLAAEACEVVPISSERGSTQDAEEVVALARRRDANWIVLDGYEFSADYQRGLKEAGFRILFLDDYGHAQHYYADLVLNQNVHADESMYKAREAYTKLLMGTYYCMLRREFSRWRNWKREVVPVARKILITMGGSDPENVTPAAVAAVRQLSHAEAIVVVGGSNRQTEEIEESIAGCNGQIQIRKDVRNMTELMAWADVAIAGAGTTCWEMCLLQLPMALIDVAENQKPIACALALSGAAIHLGGARDVSETQIADCIAGLAGSRAARVSLAHRSGELVDGWGTERVIKELSQS